MVKNLPPKQVGPGSIPGLGRFPGEENGYPLQYSWAFLIAQLVENLPAIQETQVRFLYWEDPLEKEMATCSSILAWEIPRTEEATAHAIARVGHDLATTTRNGEVNGDSEVWISDDWVDADNINQDKNCKGRRGFGKEIVYILFPLLPRW